MWPSSSLPLTGSSAHNLLRTPANDNSTQNTCFSSHFIQIGLAQIAKNQGSNNEPPLYLLIKKVQLVYHYTYQYPHTPCRVHPVTCCQATPFEWIPLGLEPGLADPPQGEWPWKFGICESHGFFHGWMEVSTQDLGSWPAFMMWICSFNFLGSVYNSVFFCRPVVTKILTTVS